MYFTIEELCKSSKAKELGIKNQPTGLFLQNLDHLICECLDPVRKLWGSAITVNSGYRCFALNRAVGGSSTSDHLKGMAADLTVHSIADNKRLFKMIVESKVPFKQLIIEGIGANNGAWVHISYDWSRLSNNRREILQQVGRNKYRRLTVKEALAL